jgi:hypothetical protein
MPLLHTGGEEVVVTNGGSTEGTPKLVRPPVRLMRSGAGCDVQLNTDVGAASGDVLLFLYTCAGRRPPDKGLEAEGIVSSAVRSQLLILLS